MGSYLEVVKGSSPKILLNLQRKYASGSVVAADLTGATITVKWRDSSNTVQSKSGTIIDEDKGQVQFWPSGSDTNGMNAGFLTFDVEVTISSVKETWKFTRQIKILSGV